MAITESRQLQPDYIEALGKTYAADLTRQAGIPSITTAQAKQPGESDAQFAQRQTEAQQYGIRHAGMKELRPTVAGQDPYQTDAYTQAADATTGLGAYQPYLTKAETAADALSGVTGPMTGAQLATRDAQGNVVTPDVVAGSYMSPYQSQVIDTTLADFDVQAAKSRTGLGAQAVSGGAFGGGRHGIAEAAFDAASNRNRSAINAQLQQQGFQQAQQARQQDYANQAGIANLQAGLGAGAQARAQAQISGLGTLGGIQQAQTQAEYDAARQGSQMAVLEPQQRLSTLGSGVTGLMGGTQGTGTSYQQQPQSSPLASALGIGSTLAGIYGLGTRGG